MSDTIGVDGVTVLRVTDMWSLRRWQQQLRGPVTGWENLHAALLNTTRGYEMLVADLVPAHWSGPAAEQYRRHERHFHDRARSIAVAADAVPCLLRRLEVAFRQATDTLTGQYERLCAQVPARRREGVVVEFRVDDEAQARAVYRAVAEAQALRCEIGAFVQEHLRSVRRGTDDLHEAIRAYHALPGDLPGPDRPRSDPGSSAG